MTYPPSSPGFPAPQQPGGYGAPVPSYPAPTAAPSRLPFYLTGLVAALGLAAYLASFGPLLSINTDIGPFGGAEFTASGLSYWTVAALVAALLAAVSLLPRKKAGAGQSYTAVIAVTAVLGVLLVIGQIINRPSGFTVGWALWLVLLFTLLQAGAAVAALLFDSGVLSAPAPRPRYEQPYQYGPPPGGFYPGAQSGQIPGQRPGYPTPYGGYPGSGGSYGSDAANTPPTGFPAYTPPATPSAPAAETPGATSGPAEDSASGPNQS